MPVNYLELKTQITAMGAESNLRMAEMEARLAQCRALLDQYNEDLLGLQRIVEEAVAQKKMLRCAVPVNDPLMFHAACDLPAPSCTILAADGSQIIPNAHDSVLYGLINVGIFRIQPGSGNVPSEMTNSTLLYGDHLYINDQSPSEDLISLLRDVRERQMLAQLARQESAPVITLTDGQLELYHEPRTHESFRNEFDNYLKALDDLALNKVITAGYVSRPRADLVVSLLSLLAGSENTAVDARPFAGITDIALLSSILQPGERSAIFRLQSSSSAAYGGKKALHFFYLNAGTASQAAYARVEIPLWVAEDPTSVNLLQSVLVEQARQAGSVPYPYPLIRAHEIAVVRMDERQQLTAMIERELLSRGIEVRRQSEKQFHKGNRGRTRRSR